MSKPQQKNITATETPEDESELPICGIIMPIANTDGYPAGHWQDVYSILSEAAEMAGFKPNLVSFDSDVGVIQKRIVQNIYSNPIVVCDISSRNANVMLELGMRLAFDKAAIIVKDESTPYSFDISPIEHLNYPTDLRYKVINEFKEKLSAKIKDTHYKSQHDANYTTFLKHYGSFEVVKIQEEEISESKFILSQLSELKSILNRQTRNTEEVTIHPSRTTRQYAIPLSELKNEISINPEIIEETLGLEGLKVLKVKLSEDKLELTISTQNPSGCPPTGWVIRRLNGSLLIP